MLVASGGGGAGGTPWGMLTMQQMQALIQNPDTAKHYELLTGWKQSADLLVEHRWQVQNYRDNLASVWPPEKNAASAAYIARLDELIANLSETYEAAISNHDAFAAATLSIGLAQKEMDDLAREYESNEQLLLTHTTQPQSASGQPQPTPSPSGEQPPVAPGRQEALYQKAVTLLSSVSGDLAQAQVNVRTPTLYEPIRIRQDQPGSDDPVYAPPPIPPVTPTFGTEGTSTGSSRPAAAFPSPTATQPIAPTPGATQPGLILGGANPNPTSPTTGISPLPAPAHTGGNPIASPGLISPAPKFSTASGPTGLPPSSAGPNRSTGVLREGVIRPGTPSAGGLHGLPPGGVIGGVPGPATGQRNIATPGARRINPIGGVIGGADVHSLGASRSGVSGNTVPYGQVGSRKSAEGDKSDHDRWDPDNPWETAEGVAPVVLPPRQHRIDPGPAIGLS